MNLRIRELRKSLNLTQEEFANIIGFKNSSISDIERGACAITERVVISICAKFNVNETWLRTGQGNMFNEEDKLFNEFFAIFSQLSKPLQDFLIQTAQNLLDAQNKIQ